MRKIKTEKLFLISCVKEAFAFPTNNPNFWKSFNFYYYKKCNIILVIVRTIFKMLMKVVRWIFMDFLSIAGWYFLLKIERQLIHLWAMKINYAFTFYCINNVTVYLSKLVLREFIRLYHLYLYYFLKDILAHILLSNILNLKMVSFPYNGV